MDYIQQALKELDNIQRIEYYLNNPKIQDYLKVLSKLLDNPESVQALKELGEA